MKDEAFESKDKQIVPFLLTQQGINFLGTRSLGPIIFFRFSPKPLCIELIDKFIAHTAPPVQPKVILDAVEAFRDRIFSMKDVNKYEKK